MPIPGFLRPIGRFVRDAARRARNILWGRFRGGYSKRLAPFPLTDASPFRNGFGVVVTSYACPIVKPPGQESYFENKLHNLRLAVSKMQGLLIGPGEIFSFWRLVGPPEELYGYKPGATIIRRKMCFTMGGGLCQLSGLLHNLALLSGFDILERHPHSIDAYGEGRYIPLGRDATVAYPNVDLAFRNPHPFPLLLHLKIERKRALGRVLSQQPLPYRIEMEVSDPIVTPSPILPAPSPDLAGQKGCGGKVVRTWRVLRHPDGRKDKMFLFESRYSPTPTYR